MPRIFILLCLFSLTYAGELIAQKTTEDDYATKNNGVEKNDKPKQKIPFNERLIYGGNLGGYFGNFSYFQINPMIGYKTTNWWVNGIGINYIYAGGGGIKQNIYGASLWSRAYLNRSLILHTEFEKLLLTATNSFGGTYRADVPVWFVGGGYQSNAGGIGLSVMLLYDLIQDSESPYSTPVFRVGGMIGF